ncbi:MAG: HAD family hydrolase [Verrucomicrobia bacterium]|nr:MAG: HAD family hydrolase [Verrucomicrobiota bacterium]
MNTNQRLVASIDHQLLAFYQNGKLVREYPISTAKKGMGFSLGSYRTPTGKFSIAEKIGDDAPLHTVFENRIATCIWETHEMDSKDRVLTRVIRLHGLDAENANTLERNIYIHGTNREDLIGQPASHGCIRLKNDDMIELFNQLDLTAELEILPATMPHGKLLFIDCDSTLSSIEGIDELARACGEDIFARSVALTEAAMNGELPIQEVFPKRMEMIRPSKQVADLVAEQYIRHIVPGAREMISHAKASGWLPIILSGGFAPLIEPLAAYLGIDHVEAVPLSFTADGDYLGYGTDYPTTRNLGKNEIIREWKKAMLPESVIMVGDGISDLETRIDVDCFIGFGGVAVRSVVRSQCDIWLDAFQPPYSWLDVCKNHFT